MNALIAVLAIAVSTSVLANPPATPSNPHAGMSGMGMHHGVMQSGKVKSLIDVPSYTYIEVSQGNRTIWLAASTVAVKKGDTIQFDNGMVMTNFFSKSLKRSFPSIYFVNSVVVANGRK